MNPYRILARKRQGEALGEDEIRSVVAGAATGADDWTDARLAAFLMAAAIRGLDGAETRALTVAMLESGDRWDLAAEIPTVGDKHSTGGVGDKVSLLLAPLLAACGRPVAMLTGRGLGHTGGTADKLETIPGLSLELDRARCLAVVHQTGFAIGVATSEVAPADRKLYALRDHTATVESIPLITGSILSKKLATGAAALVLDVKTGNGAFMPDPGRARQLARSLVDTCRALGRPAAALLTDMSQPLGTWSGNAMEVREVLDALEGRGPADLRELTWAQARELAELTGSPLSDAELDAAIRSGRAREAFDRWALAQGADPAWVAAPACDLAPVEIVATAPRDGVLGAVDTRGLGLLLGEAGGGRKRPGDAIDPGVALRMESRLGDAVRTGDPLARLYVRRDDGAWLPALARCLRVEDQGVAPVLVQERLV